MKKLMIAAAIACAAAMSQAATVQWQSGAIFGPTDGDGTIKWTDATTRLLSNNNVNWYVFSGLTEAQYNAAATEGTVYGWLKETPTDVTKTAPATQGTASTGLLTAINSTQANDTTAYYALLITYKDGDGKEWFIENSAMVTTDELGTTVSKTNMARFKGGVSGAANQIGAWSTQSVPEPTSGLLLVLGIAGLALRRRRA